MGANRLRPRQGCRRTVRDLERAGRWHALRPDREIAVGVRHTGPVRRLEPSSKHNDDRNKRGRQSGTMGGKTAIERHPLVCCALGTPVLTLCVGYFASRFDLRNLLLISALTMIATGVAFANVELFPLLVLVAFAGTTNPSSGDIGIFVPLEHAVLAQDAADPSRTEVFARYSLIGGLSAAAGALVATAPDMLVSFGV